MGGHLGLGQEPDVGLAQARSGGAEAGHVDGRKAGALDQAGRQRVIGAGHLDEAAGAQMFLELQCGMGVHGGQFIIRPPSMLIDWPVM
ncbi:MAG: hypothetical protein ABI606_18330 [Rhodoferax sp.]